MRRKLNEDKKISVCYKNLEVEYINFVPRSGMPDKIEILRKNVNWRLPEGGSAKIRIHGKNNGFLISASVDIEDKQYARELFIFKENVTGLGRHWLVGTLMQSLEDMFEEMLSSSLSAIRSAA